MRKSPETPFKSNHKNVKERHCTFAYFWGLNGFDDKWQPCFSLILCKYRPVLLLHIQFCMVYITFREAILSFLVSPGWPYSISIEPKKYWAGFKIKKNKKKTHTTTTHAHTHTYTHLCVWKCYFAAAVWWWRAVILLSFVPLQGNKAV